MTRIIAGTHRGHRLQAPAGATTRPTADRVREAVFSMIADWAGTAGLPAEQTLAELRFLDLFAGSAAIALEAASRGAKVAVAVDHDASAVRVARKNVTQTGLPVQVVQRSVSGYLQVPSQQQFDVIWADPPYDFPNSDLAGLLAEICSERWLLADGLVVLERSSRDSAPLWPAKMTQTWSRRYGETTLHFGSPGG